MLKKLYNTPNLVFFSADYTTEMELPFTGNIKAGFPSPADDFLDNNVSFHCYL